MRLINITDLEKFIRENVCAIGDDHLLLVAGDDGRRHEALPLVKTAYDVDKVVERLKKEKNPNYREDGSLMGERTAIEIDKAIEIVKAGGNS